MEVINVSFAGSPEEPSPLVAVHNSGALSPALLSQVMRFGLVGGTPEKPLLSGKLKGSRKAFTEMIQSYGHRVQVVSSSEPHQGPISRR